MCERSLEDIDWFNIAKLRSRENKHQAEMRTVKNKIKKVLVKQRTKGIVNLNVEKTLEH